MTALNQTASHASVPGDSACANPRSGTVHRLGTYATARLAVDGPSPTTVFISGEIDLTCAEELAAVLCVAIDDHPEGIELDLASVDFCDCRGLRALLIARASAQRRGRRFAIGPHSPAVALLLELTDTRFVLASPDLAMEASTGLPNDSH